jgi:ABC-2 type transport system permease protein
MDNRYSQSRAFWAITKASFRAIFSNPASIVFSILFPIIFILIFGAFGGDGVSKQRLVVKPGSDSANAVYDSLQHSQFIRIVRYDDTVQMWKDLEKGRLAGIIDIETMPLTDPRDKPGYLVNLESTSASGPGLGLVMQYFENLALKMDKQLSGSTTTHLIVKPKIHEDVIKYRQIDFILPGQLGFSILFATLFGIAFTFFTLRQQLVLKRFYATPVSRLNILFGIGLSRLFFQLMNVLILIVFGHYMLHYTLQHGLLTVLEMVVVTIVMLVLLMGMGLIFSSISKNDTTIPLYINLFGFPQILLSGTFFSIEVFPKWLQSICKILPLTQYNDAVRKISFEGLGILDCWKQLGILGIWILVIYAVLTRVMKWE